MVEETKNEDLKELETVSFEEDLKNARDELARSQASIDEHKALLADHENLLNIYSGVKDKIIDGCVKITPEFEYEKDPQYWEYFKALQRIRITQDYNTLKDKVVDSLRKTVAAKEEGIKSLKEKIARMTEPEGEEKNE